MEQPPPVLETDPQAQQPGMSLAGRLFNIFATPGEVFEQIKPARVSNANWLVPGIILIAVSWLCSTLIFSQEFVQQQMRDMTDQAIDKQVEKGKLNEQQAEQARAVGTKFAGIIAKVAGYALPVLIGLVVPFWGGLIIWLVGTQALHGDFSYMKGVEVAGLAGMVNVLDSIVRTLLILIMSNFLVSPSLALLVKNFDPQNTVHGLLAALNVMTFWVLAVRSVGLARLSATSFGKAAAWIFGIWVLQTALLTGISLGFQKIFAR